MSGDEFDNDEDNEGSDYDIDETDLESYSTVLEANEDIDEFQIFCESLQSMSFEGKKRKSIFLFFQRTSIGYNWL